MFKAALADMADKMIVAQATYEVTEPMISPQIVALRASNADILMNFSLGKSPLERFSACANLTGSRSSSCLTPSRRRRCFRKVEVRANSRARSRRDSRKWGPIRRGRTTPNTRTYLAWIRKYYPGVDPTDDLNVLAYVSADLITHVPSAAGDDLSRENIIRIASNLSDVGVPMLLACIAANTCQVASSFGNGCQAIDILGRHFRPFFQMRLEILE